MTRILTLLLLVFGGLAAVTPASAQKLPAFTLSDTEGRLVQTQQLQNNGKPMIIDFFATWCKPCIRELNAISDFYEEWQEETGVKLIAISIDDSRSAQRVKPLVVENDWPWETVLLDTNSDLKRSLGIQMIPYTLILDGSGNIVYRHNGSTDGSEYELYEVVRQHSK